MSDDIPDDIPDEVRAIIEALQKIHGPDTKIVPIAMGKIPKGKSPEERVEMIKKALREQGLEPGLGEAQEIKPMHTLVLTQGAEFESGSVRNTIHPDKVAPSLMATIPLPDGTQQVNIEFADPVVLYKLLSALMGMVVGYAYEDHAKVLERIAKKENEREHSQGETLN